MADEVEKPDKPDKKKGKPEKKASGGGFLDRANAAKLHMRLNATHGAGTLAIAAQARRFQIDRYSTGSLALDFALGGGIPAERVTKIVGKEQSGKTYLALKITADAQRRCAHCMRPVEGIEVEEAADDQGVVSYRAVAQCDCYRIGLFKPVQADGEKAEDFKARVARYKENSYEESRVAYFDAENALDFPWAQRIGVDLRRLLHVMPDKAEQAIDVYADLLFSGLSDLLILDSIAALAPEDEIEDSASDQHQGLAARLVNRWVRRVGAGSISVGLGGGRDRSPTQVWINQYRTKIGQQYGDSNVEPCGTGQRYANAVLIKTWTADWQKKDLFDSLPKDEKMKISKAVDICWVVDKNKTGPAKGEGRFTLHTSGTRAGEIDEFGFIAHLAERFGILREAEKKGKGWLLGDEEYRTKTLAFERMREPAVAASLRQKLLERMNKERDT